MMVSWCERGSGPPRLLLLSRRLGDAPDRRSDARYRKITTIRCAAAALWYSRAERCRRAHLGARASQRMDIMTICQDAGRIATTAKSWRLRPGVSPGSYESQIGTVSHRRRHDAATVPSAHP